MTTKTHVNLNASFIDESMSAAQRRVLNHYVVATNFAQKIEVTYEYLKVSTIENDIPKYFGFLKKADPEFHESIGGEIVDTIEGESRHENIVNFDAKYLHLSQIYSNYDLQAAIDLHIRCERIYREFGNSLVRFDRLKFSANKTLELLNSFKQAGIEVHDIYPKSASSFLKREVKEQTHIFNSEDCLDDQAELFTVPLEKPIERKTVKGSLADDSKLADSLWIGGTTSSNVSNVQFYKLNRARISHAPTGITFLDDNRRKYVYEMSDMYHYFRTAGKNSLSVVKDTIDEAYLLPRYGNNNYYHSLVDKTPALFGYKFLGLTCPIVSTYELDRVELQLAEKLGIPVDNIIVDKSSELEIHRALLPDIANLKPLFFQFCAELGEPHAGLPYQDVYISRRRSPDRPMVNEDRIECVAEKYGFKIIRMEDHSFDQQIAIARSSRTIMGPHGAGLANMIFAKPGCHIIELIPDKYMTPLFKQLAINCKHKYSVQVGKTDSNKAGSISSMPWRVDETKLSSLLSNIKCVEPAFVELATGT